MHYILQWCDKKIAKFLFGTSDWPKSYEYFGPSIGIDFKIRTIELDGKKIKLQIWDTAGQERFRTITTAYYRGAMGIMLVYDITNEKSFDNIKNWIRNIEEHASADVEKMILGNKCDMNDRRQVSRSVISSVEAVTLYLSLVADRFDSSKEYAQ